MEKLNELVAALYPQYGTPGSRDVDVTERRKAIDESAAAIAEAFRALEQRAESAEAERAGAGERCRMMFDAKNHWAGRARTAEAKLAELEKQTNDQKPFMYGIMTANGDAHFEDFCVSSDPGLLEDVIWEWNNTLADNEPKNRVVPLFTRPAPAINLAELVPGECIPAHYTFSGEQEGEEHPRYAEGFNACRAAILRNIEGAK